MGTFDFAPLRISRAPSTSPSSAPSPEPCFAKKTSASRWDNVFQVILLFCAILWYTGFAIKPLPFLLIFAFPAHRLFVGIDNCSTPGPQMHHDHAYFRYQNALKNHSFEGAPAGFSALLRYSRFTIY